MVPWANLGFSHGRGGGGLAKKNSTIRQPFFRSTKLIVRALPKHYKGPILANFLAAQAKF